MALAMILVVCGVLISMIVVSFTDSEFVEAVKPLSDNKNLIVSTLVMVAAITFITGVWGIASYSIKNRIFIAIFGGLCAFLAVVHGGCGTIFNSLANIQDEDMQNVCSGSEV